MIIKRTTTEIKKQDDQDRTISVALMSSFLVLMIQYFVLSSLDLSELKTGAAIQVISKVIVGLFYLYALPIALRRNFKKIVGIYVIAVFVFLLNYMLLPQNRTYIIDLLFPVFFMSLPTFVFTLSLNNLNVFKTMMLKISYIVFFVGALVGVLVFLGKISVGAYSMSLSYYMLLPAILFLDEFMEEFSLRKLLLSALSIMIILAMGSRGAILCILVFIVLKLVRPFTRISSKKALGHFSVFSVGILLLLFLENILLALYNFLLKFGINSRSLILFSCESVDLSGRDRLLDMVFVEISNNPILGIGIAGDTRIIGASYVHNFFVEIIGNYGFLLGFLISAWLIIFLVKNLLTQGEFNYNLLIIWVCLGFVHLMVSSSYLIDIKFWIFLGLLINISSRDEYEKPSLK